MLSNHDPEIPSVVLWSCMDTSLPPSLLSWLAAVFIDTDGGASTSSRTEADKEGMSFYMLRSLLA